MCSGLKSIAFLRPTTRAVKGSRVPHSAIFGYAMQRLGKTIQIIRQAKGLSVGELAKNAGFSPAHVSLIENSKREPSLEAVRRISCALQVPIDLLILASRGARESLRSDNAQTERLAASIQMMIEAEQRLRTILDEKGENDEAN